jgi:predicted nucleic acid-binding protein
VKGTFAYPNPVVAVILGAVLWIQHVVRPPHTKVLAEAIAAKAEILVTGDRDLLDVAAKAPLPIGTPRGFWVLLRVEQPKK